MARDTTAAPSVELKQAAEYFEKLGERTAAMAERVQTAEEERGVAQEEVVKAEHAAREAYDFAVMLQQFVDDMRLGLRTPAEVIAFASHWEVEEMYELKAA